MIDPSVIDAHVARTRLSRRIVEALLVAGLPVPHRNRVDEYGYSAVESRAIGVSPVEEWGE